MKRRLNTVALAGFGTLAIVSIASAQSLFLAPEASRAPVPGDVVMQPVAPAPTLESVGLIVVVPPEARIYQKHDLVEIIVNEATDFRLEQTLETDKTYDILATLREFPSLRNLLELQLRNGDTTPIVRVDASGGKGFSGEGERESRERLSARISATVLEVKPNGNLVLEARETMEADGETKTMVLSGVCRQEDITVENSILSSKLANLTIALNHEGVVDEAATKGLISRVLDTIFAF